MTEFYQTRMGHAFYEHTMPTIAKELERLNAVLERIAAALEMAVQPKEIANEDR
ncbi:MAG: hypothetical protein KJZ87_16265 [Thermoguttaceae bacterium]|nr:hypothetical protein [Thermoguttaceae bacterium]